MSAAAAILIISFLAIGAGLLAATAPATPPGTNGRIAFTRYDNASRSSGAIFIVAANGRGERRLTQPAGGVVDAQPDWSRDGSRIDFEAAAAAYGGGSAATGSSEASTQPLLLVGGHHLSGG